jgi:hypothetical protein
MAMRFISSQVVDRPIDGVFRFFAVEHVRNHPRWDPDIELWLDDDAPLAVGTVIQRRNKRSGEVVEGTMTVTEFETNRMLAMEIHDGSAVMFGKTTFEAINEDQTRLTIIIDIPWMDEGADRSFLESRLEHSAEIRKRLMETEI